MIPEGGRGRTGGAEEEGEAVKQEIQVRYRRG